MFITMRCLLAWLAWRNWHDDISHGVIPPMMWIHDVLPMVHLHGVVRMMCFGE